MFISFSFAGVLSGNLSTNTRDASIQAIAQAGAQYINTNQTFLTKLYQLIHVPPDSSISGAADTVYKGLLDSKFKLTTQKLLAKIFS